jgi:hypothetical protein
LFLLCGNSFTFRGELPAIVFIYCFHLFCCLISLDNDSRTMIESYKANLTRKKTRKILFFSIRMRNNNSNIAQWTHRFINNSTKFFHLQTNIKAKGRTRRIKQTSMNVVDDDDGCNLALEITLE